MVLARLDVEYAHHGGTDNGRLPCTYAHFQEYGIHKDAVAPAIRELVALGFVQVTRKGAAGNAEFRQPSHYRITYRCAHGAEGDGTHEYRRIKTMEDAAAIATAARRHSDPNAVRRGRKFKNPPPKIGADVDHGIQDRKE